MNGAAFGYFLLRPRRIENISNRFSSPDESAPSTFSRGAKLKRHKGVLNFAPRAGLEPATNRLHLS